MSIVYLLIGFVLLVIGGEFLVRSSVALSLKLNISRMVIGLTVVSFATSAPELLVSLQAAVDGFSDISLGNVIGSNIANIGLVLGLTALVSPLMVDRDFYRINWPVMMIFSIVLYFFLLSNNELSRIEGGALLLGLAAYLFILIKRSRRKDKVVVEEVDESLRQVRGFKMTIWLLIGIFALWGGSELLVKGAVDLATQLGISERVVSVTIIAVGTSVPELAASLIAAMKKEKAISLGNLIGSNIFNIASVLGLTALVKPIVVQSSAILTNDMFWMLGIAFILLPMLLIPKMSEMGRKEGFALIVGYSVFIVLTIT
ncbi:calcium/sodium antiporter [Christiangramia forsetii]|uniref:Sodium/calcium exchanger protein n=2 Tax=Christiangramia forsetii TaxID=411153 RepID=A0LYK8_CHRFK|nr:calcium/sodium antiporter [Christiangramia forsetii]GGG33936.1 sodium:calcium antiporter [Christiangramia forsetii]CAL65453.1 sodium/calcium exchanger protein [Christiangramia forsetii KT0803]